jgi:hypothetical protein
MNNLKYYIKHKLETKLSEIRTYGRTIITPDVIDGVYESLKNGSSMYEIKFESYVKGNGFMYPSLDRVIPIRVPLDIEREMFIKQMGEGGRYLIFLDTAECRQEQIVQILSNGV